MKRTIRILLALLISVFLFPLAIKADSTEYVRDEYGLLTQSEVEQLNAYAAEVADKYNCGVYVRVFNDMGSSYDIESFAESVYKEENLGLGAEQNGVMLILSMSGRDYDIVSYGDNAHFAFTDYAKDQMANRVVSDMSDGDFYGAFKTFIDIAEEDLEALAQGEPVDTWIPDEHYEPDPEEQEAAKRSMRMGITGISAPIISLLTCLGMKSKNKTAHIATEANQYIPKNGIHLTANHDHFLYRNQTIQHINRDRDSGGGGGHFGGTTVNSGGFSHHSGKF